MKNWIEIFRGGPQTDSAGREVNGDIFIDRAVAGFDPARHEPPVVVGHPKDNAPAFGWVAGLRRVVRDGAAVLEARFKDVAPEFADLVRQGRYRKRSASFYPDGRLRHVGFLGAAPPMVQGLADIAFAESEIAFDFEFAEGGKTREPDLSGMGVGETWFTKADLDRQLTEARESARREAEVEFAEKARESAQEARRREISARVDSYVVQGLLPPSVAQSGLKEFVTRLDAETPVEFAEGGDPMTPAEYFFGFMDQLKQMKLFAEFATAQKAGQDSASVRDLEEDGRRAARKLNQGGEKEE